MSSESSIPSYGSSSNYAPPISSQSISSDSYKNSYTPATTTQSYSSGAVKSSSGSGIVKTGGPWGGTSSAKPQTESVNKNEDVKVKNLKENDHS